MNSFADLLDHFAIECRNVIRLSRRHNSAVDDDLLVHPLRARVGEIRLERWPRCDLHTAHDAGFDERPRPVADHRDALAFIEEVLHKLHGFRIHTQPVWIHDTTGQQERIVIAGLCLVERPIDDHLITPFLVFPSADPAALRRDDVDFRSGIFERLARPQQLVLFKPVRGERGHALSFQLISHGHLR